MSRAMDEANKTNEQVNDPVLIDLPDAFSPTLITAKMARGRTFAGFSEIRIRNTIVECDYIMSNGVMTSQGTFSIVYQHGDEVSNMANAVTQALGDAFKKFERLKTT